MSVVLEQERATYREMFALDTYRGASSPGERLAPLFAGWAAPDSIVLDAGCGMGQGGAALARLGYRVCYCDLVQANAALSPFMTACLWSAADLRQLRAFGRIEYVYCCDVLEHVPPPFAMLVVSNLLQLARRGVFLSISVVPDQFGAWVGKPLHQTIQRFDQWRDQLREVGRVTDARDLGVAGVYCMEPFA